MDKVKEHLNLCNQIHSTYIKKNHDYGDSFGKSFDRYGIISAIVRMSDKWNRLEELALADKPKVDESMSDTLLDLANYCLMTHMEINKTQDTITIKNGMEEIQTTSVSAYVSNHNGEEVSIRG